MIALCIFISGCSATVIHKISANDETETGIRYYDSAPYLLVYSDGKNGLNWQIIYLPDQTHVMSANPQIIGGRTEMTLSFNSGVLTTASTVGDTTALPKALIAAVQTALPFLAETLKGPAPRAPGFPAPSLYRLVVSDGVLLFKGQQGDTKIQVPILMRPPS
jgi:hypothetical protein